MAGVFLLTCATARAQAAADSFMGVAVTPLSGTYLVLKTANVRDQPRTEGRRVAGLEQNDRVQAVGQAEGTAWIGVRRDGEDLGFVFAPLLLPLIDGELSGELDGRANLTGGPACSYAIRFSGKGAMEGEPYQTADYDVDWRCRRDGEEFRFYSLMFITEAPLAQGRNQVHQISLEFPDIAVDYDRVMATILLYDRAKGHVRFDRVSADALARKPATRELPADSVAEALLAAPAIAMSAWSEEGWMRLAAAIPEAQEPPPEAEGDAGEEGGDEPGVGLD